MTRRLISCCTDGFERRGHCFFSTPLSTLLPQSQMHRSYDGPKEYEEGQRQHGATTVREPGPQSNKATILSWIASSSPTGGETIDWVPGTHTPVVTHVSCSTVALVPLGLFTWTQPQKESTLPKPNLGQTKQPMQASSSMGV